MLQHSFFSESHDVVDFPALFSDLELRSLLRLKSFLVQRPSVVFFPVLVNDVGLSDFLHLHSRIPSQDIPLNGKYVFGLWERVEVHFLSLSFHRQGFFDFRLLGDFGVQWCDWKRRGGLVGGRRREKSYQPGFGRSWWFGCMHHSRPRRSNAQFLMQNRQRNLSFTRHSGSITFDY